jgi:hypothetical protein
MAATVMSTATLKERMVIPPSKHGTAPRTTD